MVEEVQPRQPRGPRQASLVSSPSGPMGLSVDESLQDSQDVGVVLRTNKFSISTALHRGKRSVAHSLLLGLYSQGQGHQGQENFYRCRRSGSDLGAGAFPIGHGLPTSLLTCFSRG